MAARSNLGESPGRTTADDAGQTWLEKVLVLLRIQGQGEMGLLSASGPCHALTWEIIRLYAALDERSGPLESRMGRPKIEHAMRIRNPTPIEY